MSRDNHGLVYTSGSSIETVSSITFPLTQVIPGWTEGMQLMVEGERTRFWIPENLAYNRERGCPRGLLVFDIVVLAMEYLLCHRDYLLTGLSGLITSATISLI